MSAADKDNQWSDVAPRLARLTHSGFGVHQAVRLDANDLAGRERLAHYMLRCPLGLERLIRVTHWDISPDGVVAGGQHPTVRSRIYDVSALVINWAHGLALIDLVAEDAWVNSAAFEVSDHLVVVATLKVHIKLEHLLFNLQKASEAEPPFVRPTRCSATLAHSIWKANTTWGCWTDFGLPGPCRSSRSARWDRRSATA